MTQSVDVLQKGVFSREEIQSATGIERLRMHLIDPDHVDLNNIEKNLLHNLNKTFHILIEHPRQRIAVQKIKILLDCENNKAYYLIKQAQDLYSNVLTRNTYFDKIQQRERLMKHLEFCDRTNRIKEVIMIEGLISKLDSELHNLRPEEKKKGATMPTFKLSMDPSVLAQASQQFLHPSTEEE